MLLDVRIRNVAPLIHCATDEIVPLVTGLAALGLVAFGPLPSPIDLASRLRFHMLSSVVRRHRQSLARSRSS